MWAHSNYFKTTSNSRYSTDKRQRKTKRNAEDSSNNCVKIISRLEEITSFNPFCLDLFRMLTIKKIKRWTRPSTYMWWMKQDQDLWHPSRLICFFTLFYDQREIFIKIFKLNFTLQKLIIFLIKKISWQTLISMRFKKIAMNFFKNILKT